MLLGCRPQDVDGRGELAPDLTDRHISMVTGASPALGGGRAPLGVPGDRRRHDGVVLGVAVVVVGGIFVFIGLNALATAPPVGGGQAGRPVPGASSRPRASVRTRRIAGTAWTLLGVAFIVAAFTHQVP
ncbi:MAG TPA: hypothetical protein VE991_04890, partial [Acidimicrobiales bacterium]|nr:hypothetical protein [Acidimicrobiales bacterium]